MTVSRTLLTLTARGNAIITELSRLHELVPAVFLKEPPESAQKEFLDRDKRFTIADLICDFSYFKIQEAFEAKIDSNESLKRADEEFCNDYVDTLTRFYLTFESVQRYSSDLNSLCQELQDDQHVGHTFDTLLDDVESRQLLCESFFLLGHMLLTIDSHFESSLREKIIVSYYRYSSYKSSPSSNLDETCNLMRNTGYLRASSQLRASEKRVSQQNHRPDGYPENFFARVGVDSSLVSLLVSKLISVDIYNQTVVAFPHPDHRSTALSAQASMLYVILFFCPNILHSQRSKMREITDKFFYDNWVTSIYMGDLVNLFEAWNPYKAARESLAQLFELESTRALAEQYRLRFDKAFRQVRDYLREGWLDEDRVLEHHPRMLALIRESNVILRWFLLHSHTQPDWNLKLTRSLHSVVANEFKPSDENLYIFIQSLAETEQSFLSLYENLLGRQDSMISESRLRTIETLEELKAIFSDPKPMRYIQPGSHTELASHLTELVASLSGPAEFGQNSIISSINQVTRLQDQYSDGKNLQVVQLFQETKDNLLQALRSLGLNRDIRLALHSIRDFGYAWKILAETFTPQMQHLIKENPLRVHGIGATFLKLASAFDASLIRIQQVDSKLDLMSVSKYYSSKLMGYIRDVLHVIPATILELLNSIIEIQTECVMGDLPSKISLDKLRDYSLAEKRFQMLELTHKVSHYAESLMLMQNTVLGVIQVDSRKLLEDGIRRELVCRMSDSIRENLTSESAKKCSGVQLANSLTNRLAKLNDKLGGFKRSLEYVQDYLFIYGLRMWQEELSRVVRFNVDMATSALRGKSYLQQQLAPQQHPHSHQTERRSSRADQPSKITAPVYDSHPLRSSFMVLILDELLRITDPRATIYDEQMSAWYDRQSRDLVIDLRVFELIGTSLGIVGLNGLDELCSCLLMLEVQRLDESLIALGTSGEQVDPQAQLLLDRLAKLRTPNHEPTTADRRITKDDYAQALRLVAPHSERLVGHLSSIGQLQLIRIGVAGVLSSRSRCEARNLYSCLDTLNSSLVAALKLTANISSPAPAPAPPSSSSSSQHKSSREQVFAPADNRGTATKSSTNGDDDEATCHACGELASISGDDDEVGTTPNKFDLEDSQLIFELTNHLEWVGLSDPLSKIYTLSLQTSPSSQVYEFRCNRVPIDLIFFLLLDHCSSKFLFSKSIGGFLPRVKMAKTGGISLANLLDTNGPSRGSASSRAGAANQSITDAGPLFYGIITMLNHYDPFLEGDSETDCPGPQSVTRPLDYLLNRMASFVRCSFGPVGEDFTNLSRHDLSLDSVNIILSIIELVRLTGLPIGKTLERIKLPEFIHDTFQFTICQLDA